tara:strand:- start:1154 stop:2200 length:1047 start_codon:yes stop_codon:yes gene_type:complete
MGFPKLWYLFCWIALMKLGFVTAYASEVVRKNYKIGIAPSHNTTSPNSLLNNTSQWAFVSKQIDFYKYYGVQFTGLSQFTSIDPKVLVAFAKKEKISLGCEFGDFHLSKNMTERVVQSAFKQLDPVFQNEGRVDSLHLDGPIRRMLQGFQDHPNALSLGEISSLLVKFWKKMKSRYPKIQIGLITNLPNWDYTKELHGWNGHYTDRSGVTYLQALQEIHSALLESGQKMDFLEIDCPYNYYREVKTRKGDAMVNNAAKLSHIENWCLNNGIQFHLVVNAEPRKNGAKGFYDLTCEYVQRLHQDKIYPDSFIFQSWYKQPAEHLPETKKYTFMNTARDAIHSVHQLYPK